MQLCQQKCGNRNLLQRTGRGKQAKGIFDPVCFQFQQNRSCILKVTCITKAKQIQNTFLTTSKMNEKLHHFILF